MTTESTIASYNLNSIGLFVTDHVSAMLAYWDKNLVCRFANAAYMEWFGKTREDMVDKMKINELLGPAVYEMNQPYILGALQGKPQTFEREITIPSGELRYSLASYIPDTENGEVRGFFVHVADITPIKLLEKELLRSRELEIRNKELEQFAYIASHDLQEPLRTISNYIQIIKEDYGQQLDGEVDNYLKTIAQATTRMSILVKALLDYSQLGRGKKLVSVNLENIVKDVVSDLEDLIKTSGAIIHIGSLPRLAVYETELRQVFQNLISNSIKFRLKDVKPEIWIKCEKVEKYWKFSVTDNGIGIDSKYFDRIFHIFQRLHPEAKYEGHGIGLANCKKIIELHGGKIWIESKPGEGSTFYFTISDLNQ